MVKIINSYASRAHEEGILSVFMSIGHRGAFRLQVSVSRVVEEAAWLQSNWDNQTVEPPQNYNLDSAGLCHERERQVETFLSGKIKNEPKEESMLSTC